MKPNLSIIIPVYNERENIDRLHEHLDHYLESIPINVEIIFVDDGSKDGSAEYLSSKVFDHADMCIIKLSKNFGAHAALRAGFQFARADNCMTYYVDMQTPLETIYRAYKKLLEGYDIVYAERENYKGSIGSRFFNFLTRKLIVEDYPASGIGSFIINKKVKDQLNANVESNSSIYFQLFTLGFKKIGIPYQCSPRHHGKSGWSFSKKLKLLVDSFVAFSNAPSRFVTILGAIMALTGIIWAIAIVVIKMFNIIPLQAGWPTLLAILLIGFGITNLSIGVIAEYLWRTLDAARNRPVFIVDEIIKIETEEQAEQGRNIEITK